MYSKAFFVFAVVVVAIQSNEATSISELAATDLQTIRNFTENAEQIVLSKTADVNKLMDNFDAAVAKVNNQIQTIVNNTLTQLNEKVIEGVGDVPIAGGKLESCSQKYITDIQAFELSTLNNVAGCITDKINEIITIITTTVRAITDITNNVLLLDENVATNCPVTQPQTLPKAVLHSFCVTKEVTTAAINVGKDVATITANVALASTLIASFSTLPADISACFAARAAASLISAAPLIAKLTACVVLP